MIRFAILVFVFMIWMGLAATYEEIKQIKNVLMDIRDKQEQR